MKTVMKTFMAFQCCLLSIHDDNTFAVVSVFYPYHQNLHNVQLASAHRQGLAADEFFLYFLLYMFYSPYGHISKIFLG